MSVVWAWLKEYKCTCDIMCLWWLLIKLCDPYPFNVNAVTFFLSMLYCSQHVFFGWCLKSTTAISGDEQLPEDIASGSQNMQFFSVLNVANLMPWYHCKHSYRIHILRFSHIATKQFLFIFFWNHTPKSRYEALKMNTSEAELTALSRT